MYACFEHVSQVEFDYGETRVYINADITLTVLVEVKIRPENLLLRERQLSHRVQVGRIFALTSNTVHLGLVIDDHSRWTSAGN